MKRRSFIAAAISALAAPHLSAAEILAPAPAKPLSAASLAAAMEQMFACEVGPANSVFDLVAGKIVSPTRTLAADPDRPNDKRLVLSPVQKGGRRYQYVSYVCAVEGGIPEAAEARLAQHFYDNFAKLPAGQLVWRIKPEFESQLVVEWGKTFLTAEQIEDQVWKQKRGPRSNGTIRDYFDDDQILVLPDNVELDLATDSYRYVKRKFHLHKMRMRLCLPHLCDHDEEEYALPNLVSPEGCKAHRLT